MATRHLEPLLRCLRRAAAPDATAGLSDAELLARFLTHRDESAFAAIVHRHGPLILGVCRRVLRDLHAAEDAFQATFLVLARKASSIARPEVLGHWLHGVACRTAARARADAARRRAHERRAAGHRTMDCTDDLVWRDLRPVLDEEVDRLPPRYRVPFILCYLEDRTNAEAARLLGCSRGTVATLLARARERLRRRLTGRGLTLPAGLAAVALARPAVSAALEFVTVRAAIVFAAGDLSTTGAASLAEGVARAMLMKKLKIAVTVLLMLGLTGAGGGAVAYRAAAREEPPAEDRAPPALAPQPVAVPVIPATPAAAEASRRSANFKVTAPTPEIAEKVSRAAERHRKALALRWLGREIPDWPEPCTVHVTIAVHGTGGATTFTFDGGKVREQRMHLEGPLDAVLAGCLPHEVAHTILAHRFGRPVPRWADEGIAVCSEGAAERDRHRRMLWKILDEGRRLPLRRLLELREFPSDVMVLYTQGYSLTDFLVQAGGPARLLKFVARGERDGWQGAARDCYDYDTLDDLEKDWLRHVRQDRQKEMDARATESRAEVAPPVPPAVVAARKPRGRLPDGPAPVQALAALGKDGRLGVWRSGNYYEPRTTYNDRGNAVTSYVLRSALVEACYDLDDVRVQDAKGKEVDSSDLPRLLKGETLVLVSADGKPVDPLHLRLVKEGTLVLILPMPVLPPAVPPQAAPPPLPAAPAVPPEAEGRPRRP
jgi:RNA polymerase sigma factor (sigma-70 family)